MTLSSEKLAIQGGEPLYQGDWPPGLHGSEEFADEEKEAVLRVLDKKRVFRFLPRGIDDSEATRLEARNCQFTGRPPALGVSSGPSALITARAARGVGPGDQVSVPAYTSLP